MTEVADFPQTRFTELVGCRVPVQQAPIGAVTTVALAVAVADAGGLGMLAAVRRPAKAVTEALEEALGAAQPDSRIGVNFLIPFLDLAALEVAASRAAIVECFFGEPDAEVIRRIHAGGALAAWQVGSVSEARAAADAGCDLIIAQGSEAGGHVRGVVPLLQLLDGVCPAVAVPVLAAGGIGSGRALATAISSGADGACVGTRFVATPEADAHDDYVVALLEAGADDTVLTETFSMGWPSAPHRVLRSCVEASDAPPEQRSPMPPTRDFAGSTKAAALYAGTSVGDVRSVQPAAEVLAELVNEAAALLRALPAGT